MTKPFALTDEQIAAATPDELRGLFDVACAHAGHDYAIVERRFSAAGTAGKLAVVLAKANVFSVEEAKAAVGVLNGFAGYTAAHAQHAHAVSGRREKAEAASQSIEAAILMLTQYTR